MSRSWPARRPRNGAHARDAPFRWLVIVLGVAIVVRTIAVGVGGGLGIIVGALLVLAGVSAVVPFRR